MNNLFVVGVGRSGTSLLQSMLASHSGISSLQETAFLRRWVFSGRFDRELRRGGRSHLLQVLREDDQIAPILSNLEGLLRTACQPKSGIDYYRALLNLITEPDSDYVLDKDPKLVEFLRMIKLSFRSVKVIHIVRNPLDVLVSKRSAKWSAGKSRIFYAFVNRVQLRLANTFGESLFGDDYLVISYEELLSSADIVMSRVCTWLSLRYEAAILDLPAAASLVTEREMQWKSKLLTRLDRSNSGKWQGQVTSLDINLFRSVCADGFVLSNCPIPEKQEASWLDTVVTIAESMIVRLGSLVYIGYKRWR